MGKMNQAMQHYLEDGERFADLFNGVYFKGKPVIKAEDLTEGSEHYAGVTEGTGQYAERTGISVVTQEQITEKDVISAQKLPDCRRSRKRVERQRDLKKLLRSGGVLRILAVENQNLVDYSMPFRCMEYDTMEYQKQLSRLRKKNRRAMQERKEQFTPAERLCGVKKTDRLSPVHTICLYHGVEPWDGPRTLKDMMNMGTDVDDMSAAFADYPMNLYCINEEEDFSVFHTELRQLFLAMKYRKDKEGFRKLLQEDEAFCHLEEDTVEALSVMLNAPEIWEERKLYMDENGEREEYDMCQALREWIEEERNAGIEEGIATGREEGKEEGIRALIEICQELGASRTLTVSKVMQKFSVQRERAEEYANSYWK